METSETYKESEQDLNWGDIDIPQESLIENESFQQGEGDDEDFYISDQELEGNETFIIKTEEQADENMLDILESMKEEQSQSEKPKEKQNDDDVEEESTLIIKSYKQTHVEAKEVDWTIHQENVQEKPKSLLDTLMNWSEQESQIPIQKSNESFDQDFAFTNKELSLQINPTNEDDDFANEDWNFSLECSKPQYKSPAKRYLASPTPSSSASVIESQSEEEGFDDIEFPSTLDSSTLGQLRNHVITSQLNQRRLLQDRESDDEDDDMMDFEIPDDFSKIPSPPSSNVNKSNPNPTKSDSTTKQSKFTKPITQTRASILRQKSISSKLSSVKPKAPINQIKRPRKLEQYGDGSELDSITNLEYDYSKEKKFMKPNSRVSSVGSVGHSAPWNSSLRSTTGWGGRDGGIRPMLSHRPTSEFSVIPTNKKNGMGGCSFINHKKKPKNKPTLIKNLNSSESRKVIGEMKYNPHLKTWEGNDDILHLFEKPSPTKTTKPALIKPHQLPHQIGAMQFDPVKMMWIGNEDDGDVFAGIGTSNEQEGGKVGRLSEFELTKQQKTAFFVSESGHKIFIGKWYPKIVSDGRGIGRDTSKSHLYEIYRQL